MKTDAERFLIEENCAIIQVLLVRRNSNLIQPAAGPVKVGDQHKQDRCWALMGPVPQNDEVQSMLTL